MRAATLVAPLALVAAIIGGGAVARDRADRVPVATPVGPAVDCVSLTQLRESRVRDDRTIDFITRGGRQSAYRVVLPHACPELGFEQRFAYETSLSQLCSTDIITVLHTSPIQRGASCGMGRFQPVMLPKRQDGR